MMEIWNLFHKGELLADLQYKEKERKGRSWEIAKKTMCEEYTLDWSQSKVFLVVNIVSSILPYTCHFNDHLPWKPGSASCLLDSQSSVILILIILQDSPNLCTHRLYPMDLILPVTIVTISQLPKRFWSGSFYGPNIITTRLTILQVIACRLMCCCYQVFFCIVVAAFSIGSMAPNLASIGTARGAAYMIWELIDRVWAIMIVLCFLSFCSSD